MVATIWQVLLIIWTACALIWWLIATGLVLGTRRQREKQRPVTDNTSITVFKALAGPLTASEFVHLSRCIETFVADLDQHSELIIGCHEHDQARCRQFIESMRQRYPGAHLKMVADPDPTRLAANPKISWMQILAPHASGRFWYWSDADIEAPAGTLHSLRADFSSTNVQMITSPYIIVNAPNAAAMLDALFVNLEFYPGVVLLEKMNAIAFGFGSGMLFSAESFRQQVDWNFLGSCLADDYHLGRLLQPVRLGTMRLTTTPAAETWHGALLHYLRWQKTIRWNRPGGFGAQLVVLPLIGWLTALSLMPTTGFVWWGLTAALFLDAVAAMVICHLLSCRVGVGRIFVIPLWSVIRSLTWLACWLPWPIVWRGRKWWAAYQTLPAHDKTDRNKPALAKQVK